jgi:hypothetical protein
MVPDGIPQALSEAWENQKAAPPVVSNTVRKYDEELEEQVGQQSGQPKEAEPSYICVASQNAEYGDVCEIDKKSMHDTKSAEDGHVDETKMTVGNITEWSLEGNDIEPNIQGSDLSVDGDSSSSSSSSGSSSDEDNSEDSVQTIGNSSSEDDQSEAESEHDGVEEAISAGNNVTKLNTRMAGGGENCNTINQSTTVVTAPLATEDGSTSESSGSSRGSRSASSNSDDDSAILLSQSYTEAQTIEEKRKALLASGRITPCVSALENNAVYTQESEILPTILFDDADDANRTASVTVQKDRKSDDNSSDEDSTSSSSTSSESDDEEDKYTLLKKDVSSFRSGGNDTVEQRCGDGDKANEKSTVPTALEEEDDGSTSSSSTGSSSSSDSSSDSDSDTSSSSNEGEEETREAHQISPVSGNIPPVVLSSRGRRRTPLVSANRKIVINALTGKR